MRDHLNKLTIFLAVLLISTFACVIVSSGHDDSHITFWQARSLLEYGELWNYNGERLEQSSSLLHVCLTALLSWLSGLNPVYAGYLVNIFGGVACCVLLYQCSRQLTKLIPGLSLLFLCSSTFFIYWMFSGMETNLAAACILLLLYQLTRQHQAFGFFPMFFTCLLLASVRPEMPVVLFIFSAVWCLILTLFKNFRGAGVLISSTLLSIALLTAFRFYYFDALYPNPVGIKAAGAANSAISSEVGEGLLYLYLLIDNTYTRFLLWLGIAVYLFSAAVAVFLCFKNRQHQPGILAFHLFIGIYFFFVIFSGGDWMREGRFWVPLIAPFCLVLVFSIQLLKFRSLQLITIVAFLSLQTGYAKTFFPNLNFGIPLWYEQNLANKHPHYALFERHNREHLRDIHIIGALNKYLPMMLAARTTTKPVTIMSKQMGMVSYYLASRYFGQIRIIDLGGLVENSVRDCPEAAVYGYGRQGLGMDVAKYFERLPYSAVSCGLPAPDIIFDVYGWGNKGLPELLKQQGYFIVFNQYGKFNIPFGSDISGNQLIAIHNRWLGKNIPLTEEKFNFNHYQKQLIE